MAYELQPGHLDITVLSAVSVQTSSTCPTTSLVKSLRLPMRLPYFLNNAQLTLNHHGQGQNSLQFSLRKSPWSSRGQAEAELGSENMYMNPTVVEKTN